MKFKIKKRTIKLIAIITLAMIFALITNFIPNHNVLSYILGMLFMGVIYIITEFIQDRF